MPNPICRNKFDTNIYMRKLHKKMRKGEGDCSDAIATPPAAAYDGRTGLSTDLQLLEQSGVVEAPGLCCRSIPAVVTTAVGQMAISKGREGKEGKHKMFRGWEWQGKTPKTHQEKFKVTAVPTTPSCILYMNRQRHQRHSRNHHSLIMALQESRQRKLKSKAEVKRYNPHSYQPR